MGDFFFQYRYHHDLAKLFRLEESGIFGAGCRRVRSHGLAARQHLRNVLSQIREAGIAQELGRDADRVGGHLVSALHQAEPGSLASGEPLQF